MRAMIVAAGRGTRLRPLTRLRPKPALPVQGVPVIAPLFELLVAHGVTFVRTVRVTSVPTERSPTVHTPEGPS